MNREYNEDNDISRVFARQADRGFRKGFAKFIPSCQKPIESNPKVNELNVKLIEAEEKIGSLNRAIESRACEIKRLQTAEANSQERADNLQEQVQHLKAELQKAKSSNKIKNEEKLSEKILMNDLRTALGKFHTWYTYSEKQLEVMKSILQDCKKWTEANRYKIYFSYKDMPPMSINDDEVADLCKVSVLDYPGIEDIEGISESERHSNFHNMSTQTDQLESGFLQNVEESSQNPSSQGQYPSQQLDASFTEASSDNWRFLEYSEKIQKLECEIANLREESIIFKQRARDNVLLAEQKIDLENQLDILRRQNNQIINDHEKLKDTARSQLFKDCLDRNNANEIILKMADVCERNAKLEKKVQELEESLKSKDDSSSSSSEAKKIAQLIKQRYQGEIDELKKKLAEFHPSYPFETTRVYRFSDNNPLDEAHEEHMLNQIAAAASASDAGSSLNAHKRRKLDTSHSDNENDHGGNAELVKDLRVKIEQHERSLKLQKELALQYRQIVSSLTGYQIKMREEGHCEVYSVFGRGDVFCFKKRNDEGMDLLDNEGARQWSSHVTDYLAKYDSIPAFLASVVLTLVESDASMLSSTFLNYTKDTQQVL